MLGQEAPTGHRVMCLGEMHGQGSPAPGPQPSAEPVQVHGLLGTGLRSVGQASE